MTKAPKIIYFINGAAPSAADQLAVLDLGVSVQFRNARFVAADERPEPCDGVAGHVPDAYAKIPKAEDALKAYRENLEKLRTQLGETAAPAPQGAKKGAKATGQTPAGGEAQKDGTQNPAWPGGAAGA